MGLCWPCTHLLCLHALISTLHPTPDTLNIIMFISFHWAETKRAYDLKNPGSQGDGSFFGITDDFKGKEPGYPGESSSFIMSA